MTLPDLTNFKTAQDLDDYVVARVKDLMDRYRPKPVYATVEQIIPEKKQCLVRFVGEDDSVLIPYTSIVPNEVGQTVRIEGTPGDRYITGIRGTSEQEAKLRDAQDNISSSSSAIEANKSTADESFNNIKTARPLYEGVDPTGEGTFDYQLLRLGPQGVTGVGGAGDSAHQHGIGFEVPRVTITNNIGLLGFIRHNLSSLKQNVSWLAWSEGSISEFYFDVYSLSTTDGSMTKRYSSPNIASSLTGTLTWMKGSIAPESQFTTNPKDVSVVQFSMRGSGVVRFAGTTLPAAIPPPGFVPQQIGGSRDTSGTRAPDYINGVTVSSFYGANTVYCQLGTDIASTLLPRTIYDPFDATTNLGQYLIRRTNNDYPAISGGSLVHAGPDGFVLMIHPAQMTTDQIFFDGVVSATSLNTFLSCYFGNYDGSSTYFEARFYKNRVTMGYVGGFGGTYQMVTSGPAMGSGEYRVRVQFDPATTRYSCYINDSTTEYVGFNDNSNVINRGQGNRYVGLGLQQGYFDSAGGFREFTAGDWKAIAA